MMPIVVWHSFLAACDSLPSGTGGFGFELLRSVAALVVVCVVAALALRWAARRGLGQRGGTERMRVLERIALDSRHALLLVRVGKRLLVLGTGDRGPQLVTELDPDDLEGFTDAARTDEPAPIRFADVLAKLRGAPPSAEASERRP